MWMFICFVYAIFCDMDNEHTLSSCGAGKSQVPYGLVGTQLWYTVSEDTLPRCGLGPSWGTRTSKGLNSGLALNYVHIPIYSVIIVLHYMVLGIFIYRILYDWLHVTTEIHSNLTLFQNVKIFSRRKMIKGQICKYWQLRISVEAKAAVGYHRTYFVSLFGSVYIFSNPMGMSCNVNKYFISVCLYYFCMLAELCVYYSDKYRNVKGFDNIAIGPKFSKLKLLNFWPNFFFLLSCSF